VKRFALLLSCAFALSGCAGISASLDKSGEQVVAEGMAPMGDNLVSTRQSALASAQESAQSEFARLGQPRASFDGALDRVPQHHRRAVAADLDHVLGRVRARGFEEGDHHVVDGAAAGAGGKSAQSPARVIAGFGRSGF